ncbi:hypothetical protein ES708_05596 [subsurface metagenome]
MSEELAKKIDGMRRASAEELKDTLPPVLDEIRKHGISGVLGEVPDLLSTIMKKLIEVDAARFISAVPEVSDKFMGILWQGVDALATKSDELTSILDSEELKAVLKKTDGKINVNIEASDSPLTGHFTISQGKLSGGSGLFHFKDMDFRFHGPTEVLLRLLTDDLALGLSNPKLMTDGHPGLAPFVAPVVQEVAKLIKGE